MTFCENCGNGRFPAIMTNAECGHETVRGGMKFCPKCARTKDACEACGEPLHPDPPPHTD